mmetsp:Transcript_143157/g.252668  ORF Transcript_143157/g.252668 Transcript_143157/m.252668 type:complete len:122 (-) Transcript_143157:58-423(-)
MFLTPRAGILALGAKAVGNVAASALNMLEVTEEPAAVQDETRSRQLAEEAFEEALFQEALVRSLAERPNTTEQAGNINAEVAIALAISLREVQQSADEMERARLSVADPAGTTGAAGSGAD